VSDLRIINGGKIEPAAKAEPLSNAATKVLPPSDAFPAPTNFEVGATLGNYLIVSKIGEGGMGMVYKAHDTTLDRTVALKVLSPHLFRNQEFLNRFRVEAQAQARLNGPNIVTLHSMFEIPGSLVLVMEYVEGQTLDQRLHNEGRLSVASTVWVFEQALMGVERAHRMGIVHRDLKPSNIFITNTHEIKLMDFGVAKILDSKVNTQSGSMIGTLMYISPEQIKGQDADFRSDLYTLGISLYQAVTGVLPFEKKTDYEYMNAHLHEQPLPPTSLQPAIPQELEDIILKAIDKDPEKRFQSAHELRKALLKVGMVHVRAYRRLKALRKEKDKAAFAVSPTYRREEREAEGHSALKLRASQFLARLNEKRALLLPGVMVIAVAGIAISFWVRNTTVTPATVATAPLAVAPTQPEAQPVTAAPAAATPGGPVTAGQATPASGAPQKDQALAPAAIPKPRPLARKPQAKPEPVPKPDDKKYDDLKKAWGGY
jgi:serine/threonine-protein kinase